MAHCEECGKVHNKEYGSGRFCSGSCARKVGGRASGAGRQKTVDPDIKKLKKLMVRLQKSMLKRLKEVKKGSLVPEVKLTRKDIKRITLKLAENDGGPILLIKRGKSCRVYKSPNDYKRVARAGSRNLKKYWEENGK